MGTVTTDALLHELRLCFIDNLRKCENVYDVAAACYATLLDIFERDDNVDFLTDIDALSNEENNSEVAKICRDFHEDVLLLVDKIEVSRYTNGMGVDGFSQYLTTAICEFECPDDIDEKKTFAICVFYIIEAIDIYVEKYVVPRRETLLSFGPLNKNVCCEKCVVYFKEKESILSSAYGEEKAKDSFRRPLQDRWIGSFFHEFLIIPVKRFHAGTPKIIPVGITAECREELCKNKKLKIADIPFIGFDTFDFYEIDHKRICGRGEIPHGKFSVKYYDDDTKNIERILDLLELAIYDKANIIVFPEFVLSRQMFSAVRKKLAQISDADKQHLIMVFAGTGCELDHEDKEAHNILHVLNPRGYEIGQYYKFSKFITPKDEIVHGGVISSKKKSDGAKKGELREDSSRSYLENCELLSTPGKECCLFDVNVVGRVLPAICRDVIDGVYTDNLVKLFVPTLLLVPAWSSSISSFEGWFLEYAKAVHVSSLLCNCCNAIKCDNDLIGKFVYPVKEGNEMKGEPLNVSRMEQCREGCPENRGCIRRISVDFSEGKLLAMLEECFFPNKKHILN